MNRRNTLHLILSSLILFLLASCIEVNGQANKNTQDRSKAFKEYWYEGKAELTRYQLDQARYGEIHQGEAVLIFVTEDFLTDKQVKFEGGKRGQNVQSVLKLNATRKFFTGLYPYSIMTSVFTPVSKPFSTLKVATSSQEWCGHTYTQFNLKNNRYNGTLRSYFQDEGDREFTLSKALLEDEIWALIRLQPSSLPTGKIEIIPGTVYLRLKHRDHAVEKATATIESYRDPELSQNELMKYSISYQDFSRRLDIYFESQFPHSIVAWEENVESGFGSNKKVMTTKAVRTHTMKSAYWSQNRNADRKTRNDLGISTSNY